MVKYFIVNLLIYQQVVIFLFVADIFIGCLLTLQYNFIIIYWEKQKYFLDIACAKSLKHQLFISLKAIFPDCSCFISNTLLEVCYTWLLSVTSCRLCLGKSISSEASESVPHICVIQQVLMFVYEYLYITNINVHKHYIFTHNIYIIFILYYFW